MIKLHDRIKELSYVIGIGNITLAGATKGFSTFASCYSNNDVLFYGITDGIAYELGSGIYLSGSNQIQRFPVKSTNNNSLVNFTEGTKEVYVNYPATNAVFNTSGINPAPQNSGVAFWSSPNSLSYSPYVVLDSGKGRLGIGKSAPSVALDIGGNVAYSQIRVSGLFVSESGVYFPSGNNGLSSYSGGRQLVHFEPNALSSPLSTILDLSGIVKQNILLKQQNAHMVFAGPSGDCDSPPCGPDFPTFRLLVAEDIPNLSHLYGSSQQIEFISGVLDTRITSSSGYLDNRITATSGNLDAKITATSGYFGSVSGYLDNKINNISIPSAAAGNNICDGRLSLSSTTSVFDGSGTVLYFVPHNGNGISLYNSSTSSWQLVSFNSTTVCNFSSLSPNIIYDVFAYLNGGNVAFETVAWIMHKPDWDSEEDPPTSQDTQLNSYRPTPLNQFQGILSKSGNNTRRYIGTIRTSATLFIDTPLCRLVYNQNNKVNRPIRSHIGPGPQLDPPWTFEYIYTGGIRYIPHIAPIEIINGLDSYVDAKIVLDVNTAYNRSEYMLGVVRRPEVYIVPPSGPYGDILEWIDNDSYYYTYDGVLLGGKDGFVSSDIVGGDSQDGVRKTATASIYCKSIGYEKYQGVEKTILGTPIIYGNELLQGYGIMGTYAC